MVLKNRTMQKIKTWFILKKSRRHFYAGDFLGSLIFTLSYIATSTNHSMSSSLKICIFQDSLGFTQNHYCLSALVFHAKMWLLANLYQGLCDWKVLTIRWSPWILFNKQAALNKNSCRLILISDWKKNLDRRKIKRGLSDTSQRMEQVPTNRTETKWQWKCRTNSRFFLKGLIIKAALQNQDAYLPILRYSQTAKIFYFTVLLYLKIMQE